MKILKFPSMRTIGWCYMMGVFVSYCFQRADGAIGMTWSSGKELQRPLASAVVDLFYESGITEVKIFYPKLETFTAFSGSDIGLTIYVREKSMLWKLFQNSFPFMVHRMRLAMKQNLIIRGIELEVGPSSEGSETEKHKKALDLAKHLRDKLEKDPDLSKIKVSLAYYPDVLALDKMSKPSEAKFRPDIKANMVASIKNKNIGMVVNIFPFNFVAEMKWNPDFAFFDNMSNFTIVDKTGYKYNNAFEFLYDAFYFAAVEANASKDMKLHVGQIGWPTEGHPLADQTNAQRFYKGLLPYIRSGKGTPARTGFPIDFYLHSLLDESDNDIVHGTYNRHWGIYRLDGHPKYEIDISGKGGHQHVIQGIVSLPRRWCVFKGKGVEKQRVKEEVESACNESDCTSLEPYGSCNHLDDEARVSYIFNRRFQSTGQKLDGMNGCGFGEMGKLSYNDPSNGTCIFHIGIVKVARRSARDAYVSA